MVSVITAVLAGSGAALLAAAVSGSALVAALPAGVLVAAGFLFVLMRIHHAAWRRAMTTKLFTDE